MHAVTVNLRTSIIIVSVTAAALALGFLGVIVVGKVAQTMRAAVTSEAARQEFVATWRPPRGLSVDRLLPERIGDMVTTNRGGFSRWTETGLDLSGVRGTYIARAGLTVEVIACSTRPDTEQTDRESAASSLRASMEGRSGTKRYLQVNNRWQMSSTQPPEYLDLWGLPGWLILFRSNQEIPLPFMRSYLETIAEPSGG